MKNTSGLLWKNPPSSVFHDFLILATFYLVSDAHSFCVAPCHIELELVGI
jgi:hypothetical protein